MKYLIILIFLSNNLIFAQQKPAYKLFNKYGTEIDYNTLISETEKSDIILFGEYHNNPISHWLQYELTNDLIKKYNSKIVLGAEMFESDNQLLIDEYLSRIIPENKFEDEARLWPNYKTDYKPLLNLAFDNNIKFIATNIPRRYANIVFTSGFEKIDSLGAEAKKFIAPLPIEFDENLESYKEINKMPSMSKMHKNTFLAKSQASKDATMAHFILKNWTKGKTFIHYNGAFHSDKYEGIYWYLKKSNKELNIKTITTVSQENIDKLEEQNKNIADIIILVPESMTKTH